ncbi:Metallo-dependent phosphatase-like protein [Glomus cerebriforme]|uniref:Metallo-dependent phosphatase-like protein n=1 Tax=Glomus cerebriforme TaxID=658196 RepID=A0A397SUH1_9GLOM|nr:Metallo-dependent phosphatase-like protein [Glomus cerebriforme]
MSSKKQYLLIILLLCLNLFYSDFIIKSNGFNPQNDSSRRIVAIGDLHGDYIQTIRILKLADMIDDNKNWSGGNGILVQGDIVDRGPDCLNIYKLFEQLRKEAEVVGGMVINLLGNHEFMNIQLDWRYVTFEDIKSFGSKYNRIAAFSSNGYIGKLFRSSFQVVAIVEKDTLFVHGGINLQWANKSIEKINQLGASVVEKCTDALTDPGTKKIAVTKEEISLLESDGPLWNRKFANSEDVMTEKELNKVLEVLKVKRMVIGHTPLSKEIKSKFNGKVYVIDVGISGYYGSNLAALEIIGDKVRELYPTTPSMERIEL